MFEARVAQFYRAKGYEVHENPKVRGSSENVYSVALVADGPLGALLISFGDAGGIDAAELGRVRTMARDIGATPVVAAPTLSPDLRRLAAQMGVVMVDEAMVSDSGPHPSELPNLEARPDLLRRDLDAHPWPVSGRAFSLPGTPAAPGARDVDELIADLHKARQPGPSSGPAPLAPAQQVLVPPTPAPATAQASAAAPATGTRFAWLNGGQSLVQSQVQARPDVSLSDVFGAKASAAAAVEHEATLVARTPPLERAQDAAWTAVDTVRDWPWKTILWTGAGATLFIAVIRWLA